MPKRDKKQPASDWTNGLRLPSVRPGEAIPPMKAAETDPLGSYTGTPAWGGRPTQDADDL